MAVYYLENEFLSMGVDSHGAELKSLRRKATNLEYMWCGDASYWGRTSPLLFPFVGGVYQKQYRTGGKTYAMTQHGFARDMEFVLLQKKKDFLEFQLKSTKETLEKYPYEFVLTIEYHLKENGVKVLWRVENPSQEIMYFAIGGHPGFNCPLRSGQEQTACSIQLDMDGTMVCTEITPQGMASKKQKVFELQNGRLSITEHLFDDDALVVENHQAHTVSLCDASGSPYLTVRMDAPLFGIWSPPKSNAPFVCIEPWYGRCDEEGYEGELKDRKWENALEPYGVWQASYEILVQ